MASGFRGFLMTAGNVLLYGLGVAVLLQNYELHKTVDHLNNPQPGVTVGTTFHHLAGQTMDGTFREVGGEEMSKTLLVTFTPGCGFCADQQGKWSDIAGNIRRMPGWNILWVSGDTVAATRDYCEKYGIPFSEVLADPTYRTYLQLNMQSVPTTIILKKGVVVDQWFGTLKDSNWSDLKSLIR